MLLSQIEIKNKSSRQFYKLFKLLLFEYLLIGLFAFFFSALAGEHKLFQSKIEFQFCLERGDCIKLKVADDYYERKFGLMNYKNLQIGEGMIFIFLSSIGKILDA